MPVLLSSLGWSELPGTLKHPLFMLPCSALCSPSSLQPGYSLMSENHAKELVGLSILKTKTADASSHILSAGGLAVTGESSLLLDCHDAIIKARQEGSGSAKAMNGEVGAGQRCGSSK